MWEELCRPRGDSDWLVTLPTAEAVGLSYAVPQNGTGDAAMCVVGGSGQSGGPALAKRVEKSRSLDFASLRSG